jgi:methyl-accepting chemotaxis protein/methyl-accepting chemotaxis protein-1 (serine sensor receptor)
LAKTSDKVLVFREEFRVFWNEMTLGKKLGAIFVVLGLGSGMMMYFSIHGAGTVSDQVRTLTAVAAKLQLMSTLQGELVNVQTAQRSVIMYATAKQADRVEESRRAFDTSLSRIREATARLRPMLVTQRGIQDLEGIGPALDRYTAVFSDIVSQCQRDDTAGALSLLSQAQSYASEFQFRASDLIEAQRKLSETASSEASDGQQRVVTMNVVGAVLLIGFLAVAGSVVRSVSRTLAGLVSEMNNGAHQVAGAAGQVSASSQSLAQGASEQAASLEETSASTEEINSMARKNTENSRTAAGVMAEVSGRIAEANTNLEQMVSSMREINASSDKISKIIKVIDEIAFQTNILALNAAVEAARAGEAGMGFAVVADEVRNLAQRCAQAAKDTSVLIEESIEKSNQGRIKLDEVTAAIQGVTESSSRVRTLVDEVNVGSQEQARGIEQIARAIAQMEQVTQKTAAGAEESASAGEELNAQSEALRGLIGQLAAVVHEDASQNRAAGKPAKPGPVMRSAPAPVKVPALAELAHTPKVSVAAAFPLHDDFTQF